MLFVKKPIDFNPKFEVVSCFCEYNNEVLLLHRQISKPQGNKWGVPAGKKDEKDKNISEAIKREIKEETGIELRLNDLSYFKKVYVKYPDFDFIYHIFHIDLKDKPKIKIRNQEHQSYQWIKPAEAKNLDLIEDLNTCIDLYYQT